MPLTKRPGMLVYRYGRQLKEPDMDVTRASMTRFATAERDPQAVLIIVALLLALAFGLAASAVYNIAPLGEGDLTLPFG
jgi:hypothetical protein